MDDSAKPADPATCFHIHLIKQVGPLDDGPVKSRRYRCEECSTFLMVEPYEVVVTIGPPDLASK